jgi:hypothetical protein
VKPKKAMTIINGGRDQLAAAVRDARKDIASIEARDEARLIKRRNAGEISDERFRQLRRNCLTESAVEESIAARRAELGEDVESIKQETDQALAAIREAEPTPDRPDPAEAARIWQRQRRRLDAGESPLGLAEALRVANDTEGLQVLREELGDHLAATGEDPRAAKSVLAGVRGIEAETFTGDRAEHREILGTAEKAASIVATNAGIAAKDLETTQAIFGATPEETIHMPMPSDGKRNGAVA